MDKTTFSNLGLGDIVRHASGGPSLIVTQAFGDRATALRTVDITNPVEWELVAKASFDFDMTVPKKG